MPQTINATIDGGKASSGPPLGPALATSGLDTKAVIADINDKTKAFAGMKVPVTLTVNDDKTYSIKVGAPPMFALIKLKSGLGKGSGNARTTMVGNLTLEAAMEVGEMKADDLTAASPKARLRQVAGTCVSAGITIDGLNPREFNNKVGAGGYDSHF